MGKVDETQAHQKTAAGEKEVRYSLSSMWNGYEVIYETGLSLRSLSNAGDVGDHNDPQGMHRESSIGDRCITPSLYFDYRYLCV
jgi:hypothetical protein